MRVGICVDKTDLIEGGGATLKNSIVNVLINSNSKHQFYFLSPHAPKEDIKVSKKHNIIELKKRIFRSNTNKLLTEKYKIDLVWYISPAPIIKNLLLPYAITVWDLGHRYIPYFPEVNISGWTWDKREEYYKKYLPKASIIITGNQEGKKQIINAYGITAGLIKIIPFSVPDFVFKKYQNINLKIKFNIEGDYVFYPAQFWPHKNHTRILKSLKILLKKKQNFSVVFCGSDKGNLEYIKKFSKKNGVAHKVHFLDFVSKDELINLYKKAFAMVYSSYLGPNNLPPLEAMALKCPVICADVAGMKEQLQNTALFFNPDNENEIVDSILKLKTKPTLRHNLIQKGQKLITNLKPKCYVNRMISILDEFETIRECWDNNKIWQYK